jgi:hypothetical protein
MIWWQEYAPITREAWENMKPMTQTDWIDGEALPVATDKADIPESEVQEKCVAHARNNGAYARKFSSPQNRSVPDYIFVWNGLQWFVEFKRFGKKPTKQQYEEHAAIRAAGGAVWICDDVEVFKRRFKCVRDEMDVCDCEDDYPVGEFE